MPALFRLAILHLTLIRMLGRIKDIHRPLATNSPLHKNRKISPNGLGHGDENASVVQVPFILGPADAFLVAFLRTWAFLERQSGEEEE
jgi:hypothetical protein